MAYYLVAGNDPNINYSRLAQALAAIPAGAKFVAANEGRLLPTETVSLPGAGGTIIGAIKGIIQREPDALGGIQPR